MDACCNRLFFKDLNQNRKPSHGEEKKYEPTLGRAVGTCCEPRFARAPDEQAGTAGARLLEPTNGGLD